MTTGRILTKPITRAEVGRLAEALFGSWVKAVVDTRRGVMAVGGDLHADEEAALIEDGSRQCDLWGITLHPDKPGSSWVEYQAMTNIRPGDRSHSMGIDDPARRAAIRAVVASLVTDADHS